MASPYDMEVTIQSARNLKNVNWREGDLRPYAVVWIDSSPKSSTNVDHGIDPEWYEKKLIPLSPNLSLRDATLYIDIVHADADEGVKLLIGSARLSFSVVLDQIGIHGKLDRTLKVKLQGELDIRLAVKEQPRYYDPYSQPPQSYGNPYGYRKSRDPYDYATPHAGYHYDGSTAPPSEYTYDGPAPAGIHTADLRPGVRRRGIPTEPLQRGNRYGGYQPAHGQPTSASGKRRTGLAVDAAEGLLGGRRQGIPTEPLQRGNRYGGYQPAYEQPTSGLAVEAAAGLLGGRRRGISMEPIQQGNPSGGRRRGIRMEPIQQRNPSGGRRRSIYMEPIEQGNPSGVRRHGIPSGGYKPAYGQQSSKFGMGTGLAVEAAAGLLGGLALAEEDVAYEEEDDYYSDDF